MMLSWIEWRNTMPSFASSKFGPLAKRPLLAHSFDVRPSLAEIAVYTAQLRLPAASFSLLLSKAMYKYFAERHPGALAQPGHLQRV